jgi:hypothetical protein
MEAVCTSELYITSLLQVPGDITLYFFGIYLTMLSVHRSADKSLAFPIFLFAAQLKEFFLDGLKKLEQLSHKCVELKGEYVQ